MTRKSVFWNALAVVLVAAALVAVILVVRPELEDPAASRRNARPPTRPTTRPASPDLVYRSPGAPGGVHARGASAKPPTALVLDSPRVEQRGGRGGQLLLRELPRQSLLIAAVHDLGLPVVDRTVDPSRPAPADALEVGIAATVDEKARDLHELHLVFTDPLTKWDPPGTAPQPAAAAAPSPSTRPTSALERAAANRSRRTPEQIAAARVAAAQTAAERKAIADAPGVTLKGEMVDNFVHYAKLAPQVEAIAASQWAPDIAKVTGIQAKPAKWDATLAAPDGVEALLLDVDAHDGFLAATRLHDAVATTGESPARLAALARAYANLGDASRCLFSGHSSTFFARAMVYAERAVRKAPNDASAHYARGYALALVGFPNDARAAFDRGRTLAGGGGGATMPAWAALGDDLAHFRTRKLFDAGATPGKTQRLANHFAMLTVEHTGLPSVVVNMARLVLQDDPQNLRAVHMITDNTGVGAQHESTVAAIGAQFGLLARLADEKAGAPDAIRKAAADATGGQLAPDAVRRLLAAMDAQGAPGGQMLPWGVYASLQRDALFAGVFRRLHFVKVVLGTDASEDLAQLWPLVKDHRYAALIASFDKPGGAIAGADLLERLVEANYTDLGIEATPVFRYADELRLPGQMVRDDNWIGRQSNNMDGTAWDLAHLNWAWRDKDAERIQMLSMAKGSIAKTLAKLCPDHPSAIAGQVLNDWANTKARAAEIEREFGGHPQVAYALARSYRADHREADAKRLLEQTIKIAPEAEVFEELAATIQPPANEGGNDAAAMATLMKMLSGAAAPDKPEPGASPPGGNAAEDFGLASPRAADKLARDLIAQGKLDEALPVARQAAGSGAQWACQTLIGNLTLLKKYDEAEALARETQERYPQGFDWYQWCQMTGRGDLAAARADAARNADSLEKSRDDGDRLGAGVFFQIEGKGDRAAACFDAQLASDSPEQLFKLMYAVLEFERKDAKTALKVMSIGAGVREMVGEHRGEVYRTADSELKACFEDDKRLPDREGDVKQWILDDRNSQYRANACYWFGRTCELRGDKEQAKFWYREALATPNWTYACRGLAGVALRRLGENPFKG